MVNLNHFLLQISLSILLLSISLSSAHDKPEDKVPPQPSTPVNGQPPKPSTPVDSQPPKPSTPVDSKPPEPSTPADSKLPQPSTPGPSNSIDHSSFGSKSFQGSHSFQGSSESNSNQGSSGSYSFHGSFGSNGNQGSSRSNSFQGPFGSNSDQGSSGTINFQGSSGGSINRGSSGSSSFQGSVESKGNQGSSGSNSFQGSVGSINFQGYSGGNINQGSSESSSFQGSTGSKGNQDSSGSISFQGSSGGNIDQGSSRSSSFQGSSSSKGSQGSSGSSNFQGSSESKGNKGSSGSINFQGPGGNVHQGSFESRGNQGSSESINLRGSSGSNNKQASSESSNFQGSLGSKGNQGSSGSINFQGSSGSNENQGSSENNGNQDSSDNINFDGSFSKVFAFGDSFTDTGNAYLLGNLKSSFIGSLLSHAFKSLNSSQLSGNRQCNGRLVVDFLCDSLSIPYLPPYKQSKVDFTNGANFAIAGSTSLSADFFKKFKGNSDGLNLMWQGVPSGFQTQLDWFHQFLLERGCQGKSEDACKADLENALFWIGGMGRNDYARTFGSGATFTIPRLKEMTVAHISKFLQTLIEKGARYIVVQGLPPVGCCPLELFLTKQADRDQMGCVPAINGIIKAHNELLQKMLADVQKQHSQCVILYADYWNAFNTILEKHKEYNFDEPFKTCCGAGGGLLNFNIQSTCGMLGTSACKDPSRYINWDGVHFTEAMHRHIADLLLHKDFCKPSFAHLIKIKKGLVKLGMKKLGLGK